MNRSEQINELVKALAKAQAEMQNPAFDQMNPHFRNKFASLAAVRNAVIPVLSKHGLTLTQELTSGDRGPRVLTMISHESGQWMEFGPLEMPVAKGDAQGVGSAATYARRYSMMAVCAVVGDEDDDGNEASKGKSPLSGPINPRDGFFDSLPKEDKQRILDMAIEVKDAWGANDLDTAFRAHVKHNKALEAEQKIALWDQYDSKLRSALTKRLEEVKAARAKAELGGQA